MNYKKLSLIFIVLSNFCSDLVYLSNNSSEICEAFFSEVDDVAQHLSNLINSEKKSICVAIFYLSNKEIFNALLSAAERGVKIIVVLDKRCVTPSTFKNFQKLFNAGVGLRVFKPVPNTKNIEALMHNKYCIFECCLQNKALLWTGSFNFTYTAQKYNKENALLLESPKLIEKYKLDFERLLSQAVDITEKKKFKRWLACAKPINRESFYKKTKRLIMDLFW